MLRFIPRIICRTPDKAYETTRTDVAQPHSDFVSFDRNPRNFEPDQYHSDFDFNVCARNRGPFRFDPYFDYETLETSKSHPISCDCDLYDLNYDFFDFDYDLCDCDCDFCYYDCDFCDCDCDICDCDCDFDPPSSLYDQCGPFSFYFDPDI